MDELLERLDALREQSETMYMRLVELGEPPAKWVDALDEIDNASKAVDFAALMASKAVGG